MVAPEYIGKTYRQMAAKLRIQRGAGKPDKVSERPRHAKTKQYLDTETEPTLITFEIGDQVDVEYLLKIGAILPLPKGVKRGESK